MVQDRVIDSIPVVMFTTSSSELDRSFAQTWGAAYITKPLQVKDIEALVRSLPGAVGKK